MSTPIGHTKLAELAFGLLQDLNKLDTSATLSETQQRFNRQYAEQALKYKVPPTPEKLAHILKHFLETADKQAKELQALTRTLNSSGPQSEATLGRIGDIAGLTLQACMIAEAINDLLKSPDYQARFNFPAAAERRGACMHAQGQNSRLNNLTVGEKMRAFHQEVISALDLLP